MHIEFEKFLALTTMLAAGALAVPSCTVNNTTNNNADEAGGSAGAASPAKAGATNTPNAAGSTGVTNPVVAGNAGSESIESAAGSAGAATNPVSAAGSAGTNTTPANVAGSAGAVVTPAVVAGNAGSIATSVVVAGSAGAPAVGTGGAAGAVHSVVAGAAGTSVGVAIGGAAGAPSSVGAAGAAGAAACIAGPSTEGNFDCSELSYADVSCDPSTEGGLSPYGVQVCDRYANEREGAAQVVFDCLKKLTKPASGWCSSEHITAVDSCVTKMEQQICPTSAAQSACTAINKYCPAVKVGQCISDLSPIVDDTVTGYIEPCMEGVALDGCASYYYYSCAYFPSPSLKVSEVCAELTSSCPALTPGTCDEGLDPYAYGYILKSVYEPKERCMATYKAIGGDCFDAFVTCLYQ